MPHFIFDCSQDLLEINSPEKIMSVVYEVADTSGLFAPKDVKVRLNPYQYFQLGEGKTNFMHIFGFIMEGRTTEQKSKLSKQMVAKLSELFPDISFLSININDFEAATYSNKAKIHPDNKTGDRYFNF